MKGVTSLETPPSMTQVCFGESLSRVIIVPHLDTSLLKLEVGSTLPQLKRPHRPQLDWP